MRGIILAGTRELLVITTPHEAYGFHRLLGDGSQFGISLTYAPRPSPGGLAQAFIIGADHIGSERVGLVLGDNIFYGSRLGHPYFYDHTVVGYAAGLESLNDASNHVRAIEVDRA